MTSFRPTLYLNQYPEAVSSLNTHFVSLETIDLCLTPLSLHLKMTSRRTTEHLGQVLSCSALLRRRVSLACLVISTCVGLSVNHRRGLGRGEGAQWDSRVGHMQQLMLKTKQSNVSP